MEFWRTNNDWYDAAYLDPTKVDPTVYDHEANPGATAWFKSTADELLARVPGYLDLLAAHDVACVRLTSPVAPGRVVHEDECRIVVVPTRHA